MCRSLIFPESCRSTGRPLQKHPEEGRCVLMVGGHVVDQTVETGRVAHHEIVKGRRIPTLGAGDQFVVIVRGCLQLGGHSRAYSHNRSQRRRENSFRKKIGPAGIVFPEGITP